MQCTAGAVAVHCEGGCSALRLRWAKRGTVIASPILIREKGGKRTPSGHYIPQDISAEPQKTISGTRGGYPHIHSRKPTEQKGAVTQPSTIALQPPFSTWEMISLILCRRSNHSHHQAISALEYLAG